MIISMATSPFIKTSHLIDVLCTAVLPQHLTSDKHFTKVFFDNKFEYIRIPVTLSDIRKSYN